MLNDFRNYETDPIDIDNNDDLIELIVNVIGTKINRGYFKRWSKDALLSEGWIQIQSLRKSWNADKGVPFNKYCFMYLPTRISDGMFGFEEGMAKGLTGSATRFTHRAWQFEEHENEHANPANGACCDDAFAQHKETIVDRCLNHPSLTETERTIVDMVGRGIPMKAIGAAMSVTESRISQRCKMIRSKINE